MEKGIKVKRALIVATVFKFLGFEKNDIRILKEMGYEVHCAANINQAEWLKDDGLLDDLGVIKHHIDFERTPFSKQNINAFKQLKSLIKKYNFTLIHCHTPVAATLTRIVAMKSRKTGTTVIYTAHGFHFFKGAPLKNWILYYPVEKLLSRWTDCLITINKEDYWRAKKKFYAKRTEYVPGVGVDTEFIREIEVERDKKRREINIPNDAFLLLSVGELSKRKNHIFALEILANLKIETIYYAICGQGVLEGELREYVKMNGLTDRVRFLGYRDDVVALCKTADLFVFPSLQEGLPVALMEAIASGIPCIASNIRGNCDLLKNIDGKFLLSLKKQKDWEESIRFCMEHPEDIIKIVYENQNNIESFSMKKISSKMKRIYKIVIRHIE